MILITGIGMNFIATYNEKLNIDDLGKNEQPYVYMTNSTGEKVKIPKDKLNEKPYYTKTVTIQEGETLYDEVKKYVKPDENIDLICFVAKQENPIKDVKHIKPGTQVTIKLKK